MELVDRLPIVFGSKNLEQNLGLENVASEQMVLNFFDVTGVMTFFFAVCLLMAV